MLAKELAADMRAAIKKNSLELDIPCCVFHSGAEDKFSISEVKSNEGTGVTTIYYDEDFATGVSIGEVLDVLDEYESQEVEVVNGDTFESESVEISVDDCLDTSIDINISWGEE